jgi:hypothetical protein
MSAWVVPTTTLQSQPTSNGTAPGCARYGATRSLTQSHAIRGPGQLLIGGIVWCGR